MEVQTTHCDESPEARETHERILDAAQMLFAEKGFDATSVRDITTNAGCNVAAVNYHFGGKDNLYLESFRTMLGALRDQRLAVLGKLMQQTPPPSLEDFLETFAEGFLDPLVDESRGRLFLAFVSREIFDPRLPPSVFLGEFIHPLLERAMVALDRIVPSMEPDAARLCVMSLVGQLLHALKAQHLFGQNDHPEVSAHLADFVPHFVRFSAGGIRACAIDESTAPPSFSSGEKDS